MASMIVASEARIPAPFEQVWNAVRDPRAIERWLLPANHGQAADPDSGQVWVRAGETAMAVAEVMPSDDPQVLRLRTYPDEHVSVTVQVIAEGRDSRVVISLLDEADLDGPTRAAIAGVSRTSWERGLASLTAHLTGKPLPFARIPVDGLFGFRHQQAGRDRVSRRIWLAVPRQRVWEAVTDPKQVGPWYSPTVAWQQTELAVGGRFYVPGAQTGEETHVQRIDTLDPPRHMLLRSQADSGATVFETTEYHLRDERGGTSFTVVNTTRAPDGDPERETLIERNALGWGMVLQNLRAVLTGQPPPYPQGL